MDALFNLEMPIMTKSQNVDPAEIKKFEDMASRWWDLEGEFKPLHQINPLRLNYVLEKTEGLFNKKVMPIYRVDRQAISRTSVTGNFGTRVDGNYGTVAIQGQEDCNWYAW